MAVTLQDVAKRAGVSKSAASRTFTVGASVSKATRAKVEKAAAELGYTPNVLASSLTTGRTKLIGLISNNFTNPYFLEIFDRFTFSLQKAGLRPLLVNLSHTKDAAEALDMLRQYSVDGVIVASSTLPPDFAETFQGAGLPLVHAFGWSRPSPDTYLVSIDNIAAGRFAGEALVARGYGSIGYIGGPETATTTQDRLAGLKDAVQHRFANACFAEEYSFHAGRAEMQSVIARGEVAEAYFCGDDVIAIGVLSALIDAGYKVPEDVGVLGLDDMEMAGWANIALSTIRQPTEEIVETAVSLMQQAVNKEDAPERTRLLPFSLVERGTLRPLP